MNTVYLLLLFAAVFCFFVDAFIEVRTRFRTTVNLCSLGLLFFALVPTIDLARKVF